MTTNTIIPSTVRSGVTDPSGNPIDAWTAALQEALETQDSAAIGRLFRLDGSVRDLLALSWDFRNAIGREEIASLLSEPAASTVHNIQTRHDSSPISSREDGQDCIGQFLSFRTSVGSGEGYVKLVAEEDGTWRASTFLLALKSLDSHPEQLGEQRPAGRVHGPQPDRVGWTEELDHEFTKADPTVVILGSGHNGLMLAARLKVLGIPALIVESNDRVGDNWRKRYSSLALHTPIAADELPYIPFPQTWTRFTPKDKLGDFLESYARLLDLAIWTGSSAENVRFDGETGRWSLDVVRSDGTRRSLVPEHLVFATGMNGAPRVPELPGQAEFVGRVIHAVEYTGAAKWVDKRVVVVGSGVSGHDLAQDLAEHGVDVTMIQRSGTVVMNTSTFHEVMHFNHICGQYSIDEADLLNASTPFGALPSYGAAQLNQAKEIDRELLESLTAAGFELSDGPDGQGVLGLIFGQNATGYYYNAGASELIADGTIKLRHGSVAAFTQTGITLNDGAVIDADLVIFATGYHGATAAVRNILGDGVADELGEIANVGSDREYGRLWRHSGLDRLWFMISLGIGDGRFYSKLLALQIAAVEAGTLRIGTRS